MLLATFLVPYVVLATKAVAGPTVIRNSISRISFPISRHFVHRNETGPFQELSKNSVNEVERRSSSTPKLVCNDTGLAYAISIGVGDPPTFYNLIIDTASANMWVGANTPYVQTASSVKTGDSMSIQYTSALDVTGTEYNDTVTFVTGFVIFQQAIGVADPDTGSVLDFDPFDGILGLGPRGLSIGTLNTDKSKVIPTVTDTLFQEGVISQSLVALSFQPMNQTSVTDGEMTFGDTDPSRYTGNITYFPITTADPANKYWGIDASFRYGPDTVILNTAAAVIDSLTNLILIPTDAYNAYAKATGGVFDEGTGLLSITLEQYQNLQSLYFEIGGFTYEITANAQILPRVLNVASGGTSNNTYLIVQDISFSRLPNIPIILGRPFFERFYIVLDSGNSSVGFATTQYTNAETN